MRRRTFLAASAATLALPSVARAEATRVLKFIPQSDLAILDPVWTTAYVTRNHGYMVFDTLYGQSGQQDGFKATPQMVAGHTVDADGKTWKLVLRDGLMFHNGEKVLARDCVASIKRWGARDAFGQALMQRTDELSAPDDKTIMFRLKQPFSLLPDALCHGASNMCAIMPERIAATDPFKQFTEVIGSGPFRFKTDERVQGSLFVYERFTGYKPREDGESSFTSGPKIVHFDRVEWHVQPDPTTKSAAMQAGEMDWWENPTADLLPVLRKNGIATPITDPTGTPFLLRPNHLYPPFDKPAVRRALMGAIDQKEYMTAIMGEDTSLWSAPCGFFPPVSPLASDAGLSVFGGKRDYGAVKKALEAAGYQGERVVLMGATDQPANYPLAEVAADMLKRVDVNVEYQATDWGMVVQRRALTKPPAEGGWNMFCTGFSGLDFSTPASHLPLRGNGKGAWFGWPTMPKIEELRDAWFNAPDLAAQKKAGVEIQLQAFQDVPYYPLGLAQLPTAFRQDITGVPEGFPIFWNVRRS
ncbi:MAG TPA: ABC transporter substrate-binding protein [Acetobacteraceae bacterium]|jgi:peptide/nickel transport system substrate-binding protein|nr:ABC transporter substrate-binding protein [Acetobacteraceae bacterium]